MSGVAAAQWMRGLLTGLSVPVAHDNAPFTPPEGAYARMLIRGGAGAQASLGPAPLHRYDGVVVVEVHTPAGTGTGESEALCEEVEARFRGQRSGGTRFATPYTVPVGVVDGTWYKADVIAPFERDTIHSD